MCCNVHTRRATLSTIELRNGFPNGYVRGFDIEKGEKAVMKKFIFSFFIMSLFAGMLVFAAPSSVQAQAQQKTYLRKVVRNGKVRYIRVKKPSFYRRHRNRVNMALGTGAGALIGGIAGGGKGALIGAGVGAGSSALYTYVWNKKKRKYVKVRLN